MPTGVPPLRLGAAALAAVCWVYWFLYAADWPGKPATLLWLLTLFLWSAALFDPPRPRRPDLVTLWALLITGLTIVPRLWSLTDEPYSVSTDEICYSVAGYAVFPEKLWEIFRSYDGACVNANYLARALQLWPVTFVEPLYGVRLASVIYGVVSIVATYGLARALAGRTVAAVAVAVIACNYWHMAMSRTAYPNIVAVTVVCLALWAMVAGAERRSHLLQFLGGCLAGMSLLVYDMARVVVPVTILWLAHRLVLSRVTWRQALSAIFSVGLGALVFLTPYLMTQGAASSLSRWRVVALIDPGAPIPRMRDSGWDPGTILQVAQEQASWAASVYVTHGGWIGPHDSSPAPIIDPLSLAMAVCGLALAIARPRDSGRFLILAWVGCTFVLGQALTPYPNYRMGVIIPALAIAAGFTADSLSRHLLTRFGRYATLLRGLALVALVCAILPLNLSYLWSFLKGRSHRHPNEVMARFIHDGGTDPVYYVIGPGLLGHNLTFQFLTHERTVIEAPSLDDVLCGDLDVNREAVFVLHYTELPTAVDVLRGRFPEAEIVRTKDEENPAALAVVVPAQSLTAAGVCSGRNGLLARLYTGSDWQGEVQKEQVEGLPYRWFPPWRSFQSVEWSGFLEVPENVEYRFWLRTHMTEGSLVVGTHEIAAEERVGFTLSPGSHPIRIRCRPTENYGNCQLLWAPPGQDFRPIPPGRLSPTVPAQAAQTRAAQGDT